MSIGTDRGGCSEATDPDRRHTRTQHDSKSNHNRAITDRTRAGSGSGRPPDTGDRLRSASDAARHLVERPCCHLYMIVSSGSRSLGPACIIPGKTFSAYWMVRRGTHSGQTQKSAAIGNLCSSPLPLPQTSDDPSIVPFPPSSSVVPLPVPHINAHFCLSSQRLHSLPGLSLTPVPIPRSRGVITPTPGLKAARPSFRSSPHQGRAEVVLLTASPAPSGSSARSSRSVSMYGIRSGRNIRPSATFSALVS